MTKSKLFSASKYKGVEKRIVELINSQPEFLSTKTSTSPRAVGDAIQEILSDSLRSLLGDFCVEYRAHFPRRAMGDLAFRGDDGLYYLVDVKTQRLEEGFHMPNLTSVRRLSELYDDDSNFFVILIVEYTVKKNVVQTKKVHFVPIEFLSWNCLTVGALGWGQIQIANGKVIRINEGFPRKTWMLALCDAMLRFYPKEVKKIGRRIGYFRNVRKRWQGRNVGA